MNLPFVRVHSLAVFVVITLTCMMRNEPYSTFQPFYQTSRHLLPDRLCTSIACIVVSFTMKLAAASGIKMQSLPLCDGLRNFMPFVLLDLS